MKRMARTSILSRRNWKEARSKTTDGLRIRLILRSLPQVQSAPAGSGDGLSLCNLITCRSRPAGVWTSTKATPAQLACQPLQLTLYLYNAIAGCCISFVVLLSSLQTASHFRLVFFCARQDVFLTAAVTPHAIFDIRTTMQK